MNHYKKVLEYYNIGITEKLIELIENSNDKSTLRLTYLINQILVDSIDDAKISVFLLNKAYLSSKLFHKHWTDSIYSNKKIILVQLEKSLTVPNELIHNPTLQYTNDDGKLLKEFINFVLVSQVTKYLL